MKTFLIDYFILDEGDERMHDYHETCEIEAENYEDAEMKLHGSKGNVEITSVFTEEN